MSGTSPKTYVLRFSDPTVADEHVADGELTVRHIVVLAAGNALLVCIDEAGQETTIIDVGSHSSN